jgi:DNA modification methylase
VAVNRCCEFGDCREILRQQPAETFACCVTSPPYFNLRDYGVEGQLGLEATPDEYVARMVDVFREVRRVLRADGTCWINIGDSYAGGTIGRDDRDEVSFRSRYEAEGTGRPKLGREGSSGSRRPPTPGLKAKDMIGIPWMLAFALRADGWYLRSEIIWAKPNPMPESVTDRPTKAHETIFLLSKSATYHYDADAIRTPLADKTFTTFGTGRISKGTDALGKVAADNWSRDVPIRKPRMKRPGKNDLPRSTPNQDRRVAGFNGRYDEAEANGEIAGANKRTVWTVATQPYDGAHFATFPPDLIKPCILAGCPEGGVVLDPFLGSGTTGMVAEALGRRWFGCELNPAYEPLIRARTAQVGMIFPAAVAT